MKKRYSTIDQELEKQGRCFFQTVGDSMEPLLHNRRSTVVIERISVLPQKYDVVLYRRPAREYVLHRIVKVREKDYLICGDNRTWRESVPKEWILGVMVGFYPDEGERYISCQDGKYQKYLHTLWIRYSICRIRMLRERISRKWKLKND